MQCAQKKNKKKRKEKKSDIQKLSLIESRCVGFHLNYKILQGQVCLRTTLSYGLLKKKNIVLWQPLLIS